MKTLKNGCKGDEVKTLQKLLNKEGYNLVVDSDFGQKTHDALVAWQKAHGLVADGIVGPKTWAALSDAKLVEVYEIAKGIRKSKRKINLIVVHSTATPEGEDYTVENIRKLHKSKGYGDIGYHYVIYRDGSLHEGRDVNLVGAHARRHNSNSIGIVYIGGTSATEKDKNGHLKAKDTRTPEQKATLLKLLKDLRKLYPNAKIVGHRDLNATACPSFDAKSEYKMI